MRPFNYQDIWTVERVVIDLQMRQKASEIVSGSYRNNYDVRDTDTRILHALQGLAIEQALIQKGAQRNRLEHDPRNPDSFAYDVLIEGKRTEVKMMILGKGDVFPSYNRQSFSRFEKYINYVDLFAGGIPGKPVNQKCFYVKLALITTPEVLFKYSVPSSFPEKYGAHNHWFDFRNAPEGSYHLNPEILDKYLKKSKKYVSK